MVILAALAAFAPRADAQVGKKYYINAGWKFNGTVSNPVASGAQGWGAYIEGGYYLTPNLAVGAFADYSTNNEYIPKQTYVYENAALTTDLDRSLFQIPFGATLRYRFTRTKLEPYVEAKLGANYSEQYTYMATYYARDTNWGFYASPEIGLTWHPFTKSNFGFQFALYYNYATNRNASYGLNGINNLGFKLGFAF